MKNSVKGSITGAEQPDGGGREDDSEANGQRAPIAEVARKSAAPRRFESEAPHPLQPTKLYIQNSTGFSAALRKEMTKSSIPIAAGDGVGEGESIAATAAAAASGTLSDRVSVGEAIRAATLIEQWFKSVSLMSEGVLAGMAVTHLLMVEHCSPDSQRNVFAVCFDDRSTFRAYSDLFSYSIALSTTSALDKIEAARIHAASVHHVLFERSKAVFTLALYFIALSLHLFALKINEDLSTLAHHSLINVTDVPDVPEPNSPQAISVGEELIALSYKTTVSRDFFAVLAWLSSCVVSSRRDRRVSSAT